MTNERKFYFILEETNTGYSAYMENTPIFTTGATPLEVKMNALEALKLHYEDQSLNISINDIILEEAK